MKKRIARDAIGKSAVGVPDEKVWSRLLTLFSLESDSDSEIQAPTNRGNKLKQKAKFVREGKLGPPTGPSVYKEVNCSFIATTVKARVKHCANSRTQEVEHAGYRRAIISRNPPLVDEDGYDIDSDDDEERVQDAIAVAAENDPYSTIRLERMSFIIANHSSNKIILMLYRITRPSYVRHRAAHPPHTLATLHLDSSQRVSKPRLRPNA